MSGLFKREPKKGKRIRFSMDFSEGDWELLKKAVGVSEAGTSARLLRFLVRVWVNVLLLEKEGFSILDGTSKLALVKDGRARLVPMPKPVDLKDAKDPRHPTQEDPSPDLPQDPRHPTQEDP